MKVEKDRKKTKTKEISSRNRSSYTIYSYEATKNYLSERHIKARIQEEELQITMTLPITTRYYKKRHYYYHLKTYFLRGQMNS